ncbi:MAG: NADH-quinone oxidoreductase subunit L [Arcobacter sp.]|nr:MAG: NADH-quinone oxidoreductase subunit L [Arcobacter sp.]
MSSSLLGWIVGSVFISSVFIMLINLYAKYNEDIPKEIYTLLGLGGPALSLIFSFILIYDFLQTGIGFHYHVFTWLNIEGLIVNASLMLDALSAAMLIFVSFVGFIIHLYAHAYMKDDRSYARFFAWFNLFMTSMFLLILADNPIMMFIGWEGVGLCSYLLISFYFESQENVEAGNKAFILNRIGDFGFLSGLSILFLYLGHTGLSFFALEENIHLIPQASLNLIAFLLFVGAMGKSAQIPLYIWLPDAMAGPTPVSALIHAATMVTAGVYMVARFNFLYIMTPEIGLFIAYVGAFTALLAALIAMRQDDIKKILAYSTMSQLGYMFMAVGLGAYSYGIFHVFTHAFFKALLFMGAGAIILLLHHEQDIKKMGRLKEKMPFIFAMMLIATLSISGLPPFSGFFSKDAILNHLFASGNYLIFGMALLTAGLTSYYMFRLLILVFISPSSKKHPLLEPSKLINITIFILSIGAIFLGFVNLPAFFGGNESYSIWLNLPDIRFHLSHSSELILLFVNISVSLTGIFFAFSHYKLSSKDPILGFLDKPIKNKFYIDEIYYFIFVKPLAWLSVFFVKVIDEKIIDAFIHKLSSGYQRLSYYSDSVQNGNVRYYALYMSVGIVCIFVYLGVS